MNPEETPLSVAEVGRSSTAASTDIIVLFLTRLLLGWLALAAIIPVAAGQVVAWGSATYGRTTVPPEASNAVAIAAGGYHALALLSDGTVVGWGNNQYGNASPPADLTNAVAISAGDVHSMALRADGTVVAWGGNSLGQTTVPSGLTNVAAVSAAYDHSYAIKEDGTVTAWGRVPTVFVGGRLRRVSDFMTNTLSVFAGFGGNVISLRSNGVVVGWGNYTVPAGLNDVTAISTRHSHNLALRADGTVEAWGDNPFGQASVPSGLSDVQAIAAGATHSLALKSNGTVVAWGRNDAGQTDTPSGLTNVVAIAAGNGFSLALVSTTLTADRPRVEILRRDDGFTLACWLQNATGTFFIEAADTPDGLEQTAVRVHTDVIPGGRYLEWPIPLASGAGSRFFRLVEEPAP